jgi:hypothetical protein
MKEFSRDWFIAEAKAASKMVESWPENIRRNMVFASASLPIINQTKADQKNNIVSPVGNVKSLEEN